MQIGELASALGVTTKTLRHYERIGLIPPAQRARSGYRVFSPDAVRRARLVVDLRGLGLSIEKVRTLLAGGNGTMRRRLLGLLEEELQRHAIQIAILQGRHDDLDARYRALLTTRPADSPAAPDCVCAALLRPCDCGSLKEQDGGTC
jgi:DNA-binding transcriptional MerR regulator